MIQCINIDFAVCNPNPCQNGGKCVSQDESYFICECPNHCHGKNCETCNQGKSLHETETNCFGSLFPGVNTNYSFSYSHFSSFSIKIWISNPLVD